MDERSSLSFESDMEVRPMPRPTPRTYTVFFCFALWLGAAALWCGLLAPQVLPADSNQPASYSDIPAPATPVELTKPLPAAIPAAYQIK
jgi:hypothetical protein